jgi:5-formyltetrahydrofolate cyclo-ligase
MSRSLQDQKHALRRDMALRRRSVPADVAETVARAATDVLMATDVASTAPRIGLYAALRDELPSRPLFDAVVSARKEAWLPRMGPGRSLEFARVRCWGELMPGPHGVMEPAASQLAEALAAEDVVVVPGVAFDARGNRLGRGGGYYDVTFPPGAPAPTLIGMAYEFQIVDAVPHDARDRRVDALVTECQLRSCGGANG